MCGIVGLFLKDDSLAPQLGGMLSEMLVTMTDRGPDSAGIALYGASRGSSFKVTVQSDDPANDFNGLAAHLSSATGKPCSIEEKSTHAVISTDSSNAGKLVAQCGMHTMNCASWPPVKAWKSTRKLACQRT